MKWSASSMKARGKPSSSGFATISAISKPTAQPRNFPQASRNRRLLSSQLRCAIGAALGSDWDRRRAVGAILGLWCSGRCGLVPTIHHADQEKNRKRYNQKVDDVV